MPFLEEEFNYGKREDTGIREPMLRSMEEAYEQTAVTVNGKADVYVKTSAPSGTPDASNHIPSTVDVNYRDGTIWIVQDGATGPITAEVYIKAQTIVSGGNKTALWVRLV